MFHAKAVKYFTQKTQSLKINENVLVIFCGVLEFS